MNRILPLCLGLGLIFVGCKKSDTAPGAPHPAPSPAVAAANPFASLVGKWRRTDGDYTIEIKSITPEGKADAAYFNPSSIHVSWALAQKRDSGLSLELELRDQNYPGCLYKLTPQSSPDQLAGTYFQAMSKEEFAVLFIREK